MRPKIKQDGTPSYEGLKYKKRKRVHFLSAEQELASTKIADDLITTMSQMIDDRIEEHKDLKLLYHQQADEELELIHSLILRRLKAAIKGLAQL